MNSPLIAFTFPGQGSQKPGMGAMWQDHPSWELVAEASKASGRDVEHLLLEATADELKETHNSQLATYVVSMIALDAVERVGVDAAFFAGHSLGEYSALTAAGTLSFNAGVKLVTERGNAMKAAAEEMPGTMAAVLGLEDEQVEMCCNRCDDEVWVANYNTPGQVIIAGTVSGIEKATVEAKNEGAKRVLPIKVGGAFHTSLMAPARDRLKKALTETDMREPSNPVYANVDAKAHTDPADWLNLLSAQLTSPVRWRQILSSLEQVGANVFIELGAGTVLSGMSKRTLKDAKTLSVGSPAEVDKLLEELASVRKDSQEDGDHDGEVLYAMERLVISPCAGVFEPHIDVTNGGEVKRGQIVGTVGDTEVKSPFSGFLQGLLALAGERVNTSQPLAWLRINS